LTAAHCVESLADPNHFTQFEVPADALKVFIMDNNINVIFPFIFVLDTWILKN